LLAAGADNTTAATTEEAFTYKYYSFPYTYQVTDSQGL
jgi:hypothetical protein